MSLELESIYQAKGLLATLDSRPTGKDETPLLVLAVV